MVSRRNHSNWCGECASTVERGKLLGAKQWIGETGLFAFVEVSFRNIFDSTLNIDGFIWKFMIFSEHLRLSNWYTISKYQKSWKDLKFSKELKQYLHEYLIFFEKFIETFPIFQNVKLKNYRKFSIDCNLPKKNENSCILKSEYS